MPGRISPRARAYVRRRAAEAMEATIRIERRVATGKAYNPTTFTITTNDRRTLYQGKARVYSVSTGPNVQIGPDSISLQQTRISIPHDAEELPRIDDEFVILGHVSDPSMVGRRGVVTGTPKAGDLRATRTFDVTLIEEEGSHLGDED